MFGALYANELLSDVPLYSLICLAIVLAFCGACSVLALAELIHRLRKKVSRESVNHVTQDAENS